MMNILNGIIAQEKKTKYNKGEKRVKKNLNSILI